jgi:hypothetical protein
MTSVRGAAPLGACLLLVVGACAPDGGRGRGERSGPSLVPVDSIRLAEADTLYIGNPYTPVIDPYDGTIYVPDLFSERVHRFARDGSRILTYGRPGEGPGEFRSAGATFVLDDSTLAVHDGILGRLSLFDRGTGRFRRLRGMRGVPGLTPPIVREDGVWLALVDQEYDDPRFAVPRSVARWLPERDSIVYLGPMPAEFTQSIEGGFWRYANQNLRGQLAFHRGAILRGWQLESRLFVLSPAGVVRDTLDIPAVRRLGVPTNVRELLDVEQIGQLERLERFSWLRQLHTLPDGGLAFTHHDQHVLTLSPTPVLAATVWVGVLSSDLEHACVDAFLPVSQDARSMETFRGDTLFQLDRRIVNGRLETWLRLFRIDVSNCDWIAVR